MNVTPQIEKLDNGSYLVTPFTKAEERFFDAFLRLLQNLNAFIILPMRLNPLLKIARRILTINQISFSVHTGRFSANLHN